MSKKIFKRGTLTTGTKEPKKKNEKNRRRNVIMNFRVTPEEKALIDARIKLSGLSRQEYFINSCTQQQIVALGNVKTFDAIRQDMRSIAAYLESGQHDDQMTQTVLLQTRTILEILQSVYGDEK